MTDDEICELVPKIGLRTVFRALLRQWRDVHFNTVTLQNRVPPIPYNDNESFLDQIELKTECHSEDFEMNSSYTKGKFPRKV